MAADGQSAEEVRHLAARLLSEEMLHAVLDLVVQLTLANLSRADGVSISLAKDGGFETANAVPVELEKLDDAQYDTRAGPCVAAMTTGEVVDAVLDDHRAAWSRFVATATERGFGSVLSVPMRVRERPIGSVNVYSSCDEHFTADDRRHAEEFARYGAVVIANAATVATTADQNEQLRIALVTRERIGEAKGILMKRDGVTSDEAFAVLRRESQRTNRKLRDIAQDLIGSLGNVDPCDG